MGMFGALDGVQGKTLYNLMSAACGSAFMLYGWDAGELVSDDKVENSLTEMIGVLGGIQATPQFLDAIGNPTGAFVSTNSRVEQLPDGPLLTLKPSVYRSFQSLHPSTILLLV